MQEWSSATAIRQAVLWQRGLSSFRRSSSTSQHTTSCFGRVVRSQHDGNEHEEPPSVAAAANHILSLRLKESKQYKPPPSPVLVDALRSTGHDLALPQALALRHVDLSNIAPGKNFSAHLKDRAESQEPERINQESVTLQAILAKYIKENNPASTFYDTPEEEDSAEEGEINALEQDRSQPELEEDIITADDQQLDDEPLVTSESSSPELPQDHDGHNSFLAARGFDFSDVKQWAELLCEIHPDVAARKMQAHQRPDLDQSVTRKPLPIFVLLFFLRRRRLSPAALRYCLVMAWQEVRMKREVQKRRNGAAKARLHGDPGVLDSHSFFILVIRLLRHARLIWPAALPTISAMFMQYNKPATTDARQPQNRNGMSLRLSRLYNQVLALLALPVSQNPFQAQSIQQRAQFDLVKDMTEHTPPLSISRKGYQAIISVQLGNKKTEQERDWDRLKARSWPPWKQEKIGLDAEKDREYGTSRAMHVLNQAREAGYGFGSWENNASILAGWDTDGSPSIQSRAFLLLKTIRSGQPGKEHTDVLDTGYTASEESRLWASRIRTTRTLQEAWACFLTYKDQKLRPTQLVYLATLAKIAAEDTRLANLQTSKATGSSFVSKTSMPHSAGDGIEVVAPPESPKEATYLHTPPPSFDELATEMLSHKIDFERASLAFLLRNASSIKHGIKYLRLAGEDHIHNIQLLTRSGNVDMEAISPYVFSAWIGLLCRFPSGRWNREERPPVIHALHLLRMSQYHKRSAWHAVLAAVGFFKLTGRADARISFAAPNSNRPEPPTFVQGVVQDMAHAGLSPDTETLRLLCVGMESAILHAQDIVETLRAREAPNKSSLHPQDRLGHVTAADLQPNNTRSAIKLLGEGPHYIHSIFNTVMGVGNRKALANAIKLGEEHNLPRLLAAPNPEMLHAYVRVLGALQDWQGLFNTIEFMVKYQAEIAAAVEMPRNGEKLLRKTIVAVAVYLERSWVQGEVVRADQQAAPKKTVAKVRKMVEGVEAWGGWPNEREIAEYCARGRFPGKADVV